jgi:nucleoside-diphosphate-sugar epimerase
MSLGHRAGGFIGFTDAVSGSGGTGADRPCEPSDADEFRILDLRRWKDVVEATRDVEEVYALAADMGGMGFISKNHAQILRNNSLINIHTLEAARRHRVRRLLFTSSACIYPESLQERPEVTPLREEQAYPAAPQDAYGWEKS